MKYKDFSVVLCAMAAVLTVAVSIAMLERQTIGLDIKRMNLEGSPVTIWRKNGGEPAPLAVVAHGYAGSRQMMHAISLTLARAGFVVAAFDFQGHGRHAQPMSRDISSLEGTTAQLINQTLAVARSVQALPGVSEPTALVGHSMATDIVIRSAARLENVSGVVAISMYSDAVQAEFPTHLLIVSGAWESRLREVALDRLRQLDPLAEEGETVEAGGLKRRAIVAHGVGHVGVLYSQTTLSEVREWLGAPNTSTTGHGTLRSWPWLAALLLSTLAFAWPLSVGFGKPRPAPRRQRSIGLMATFAPVLPALLATYFVPDGALGLSAFGKLAVFLGVWGAVQLAVLGRSREQFSTLNFKGMLILLFWGLCLFAPLLDRYGAAFVPTGPRLLTMALICLGTVPFCIADAMVTRGGDRLVWGLARALPLATLLLSMVLTPRLGVAFTVLPVMILFWCVYGLAGKWIAARTSTMTSGLALGIMLAWAIASSTPMVAY